MKQNAIVKIAGQKVRENDARTRAMRAEGLPRLNNQSTLTGVVERQRVEIPRGALGYFPQQAIIVPQVPLVIEQGSNALALSITTLGQPLTQLIQIREGVRAAQADARAAQADLDRARNEIAFHVHEVYYGLLIADRQARAAESRIAASEARLRDARTAVEAGNVLEVQTIGARAALLESRHALLQVSDQRAELEMQLNDLMGLALGTPLELEPPPPVAPAGAALEVLQQDALRANPEIRAAEQTVEKARHGLAAARADAIPGISVFAQHLYQNGVPFLSRNNGVFGLRMEWNVFDSGKRRSVTAERQAQLAQAEENLRRLRGRHAIEVEKAWRKRERARRMVEVAEEGLALRKEMYRLAADQLEAGVSSGSAHAEAAAALDKSAADALAAELALRLAQAELDLAVGVSAAP